MRGTIDTGPQIHLDTWHQRAAEIAVEDDIPERPQVPVLQVHQEEREIIEDIRAGDGLREFDGVEKRRFAAEKAKNR